MNKSDEKWTERNINSTTTIQRYIPLTIHFRLKVFLCITYLMVGIYAVVANLLILLFKKRQRTQRKGQANQAFRRDVTNVFIQSLAWSDLLCGIIVIPIYIVAFSVDVLKNQWVCKIVRYFSVVFPAVTIINLFIIGIERYLGIFHPLFMPSTQTIRRSVIGAWVAGFVLSFITLTMFTPVIHNIGPDSYTLMCVIKITSQEQRVIFLILPIFIYYIPCVVIIIISVRILRFVRRQKNNPRNLREFNSANVFAKIILTFIVPYQFFVLLSGLEVIQEKNFGYHTDYVLRNLSALLAFSNSAINPTLAFLSFPFLRRMLREFIINYFICGRHRIHQNIVRGVNEAKDQPSSNLRGPVGVVKQKDSNLNCKRNDVQGKAKLNMNEIVTRVNYTGKINQEIRELNIVEPRNDDQSTIQNQYYSH